MIAQLTRLLEAREGGFGFDEPMSPRRQYGSYGRSELLWVGVAIPGRAPGLVALFHCAPQALYRGSIRSFLDCICHYSVHSLIVPSQRSSPRSARSVRTKSSLLLTAP